MTDRELLELAAKAAGFAGVYGTHCGQTGIHNGHRLDAWNPLTDDGDALRLAVKLGILVESWAFRSHACARADATRVYVTEPHGDDIFAATRRAIVRAAAYMAKGAS